MFVYQQKNMIENISIVFATSFLEQMLDAVDFIHSEGIVHRDIKPANIIYNPTTNIFTLIDFGLSCITDQCKQLVGTIKFISKEVLYTALKRERISFHQWERNDMFALGVTLYMLLNNQLPFHVLKDKQFLDYSKPIPWIWEKDVDIVEQVKKLINIGL